MHLPPVPWNSGGTRIGPPPRRKALTKSKSMSHFKPMTKTELIKDEGMYVCMFQCVCMCGYLVFCVFGMVYLMACEIYVDKSSRCVVFIIYIYNI